MPDLFKDTKTAQAHRMAGQPAMPALPPTAARGQAMPVQPSPKRGRGGLQGVPTSTRMNPGGIEAMKAGIKQLLSQGIPANEIIDVLIQLVEREGLGIPPEKVEQLVMSVAEGTNEMRA